jgi:hypothetical protein
MSDSPQAQGKLSDKIVVLDVILDWLLNGGDRPS